MRKKGFSSRVAAVANGGLHGAIDELVNSKPGLRNTDLMQVPQVAVVLVQRHMEEDYTDRPHMLWHKCIVSTRSGLRVMVFQLGKEALRQPLA